MVAVLEKPVSQALTSSSARISDPLQLAIISLVGVMTADFGERFTRQFRDDIDGEQNTLRMYKRRLYKKLRGLSAKAIIDGYESYVDAHPGLIPGIPEIYRYAHDRQVAANAEENESSEIARIASLPAPEAENGADGVSAKGLARIAALRASAAAGASAGDEAERSARLASALASHAGNLAEARRAGRIKSAVLDVEGHRCAVANCPELGALSRSITGGTHWVCARHARHFT